MTKKQIIISVLAGFLVFVATFLGVYMLLTNDDNKPKEKKEKPKNAIILKDYTVSYGTYIGEEKEYNPETEKITSKVVKMEVTKDTINGQKYTVKENSIYVNNYEMYEVTKNDELKLLAGYGIEYKLNK